MSALRCNVSDLLHHPASRRPERIAIPGSELGGTAGARLSAAPLTIEVMLEHVPEGIVVHGHVSGEYEGECSRCLTPVQDTFTVPVREMFERAPIDGETYQLEGEEVDLELPVRDAVLLDLPQNLLCRDDCAGLCPECGVDHNETDCQCDLNPPDPRWDALRALTFDD
ncbi:MAG: DUF177 domain-containing protein [Acidimicrobiia bacterium]